MVGLKTILSRFNGVAVSLLLHGGLAIMAAISVFSVQMSGGSGRGSGGATGSGTLSTESYGATLRSGDEQTISGTVLPDTEQYGRLSSQDDVPDPDAEEVPPPSTPVDVFAVGPSQPATPSTTETPSLADPVERRPGAGEGRTAKLPAAIDRGSGADESAGSTGGAGSGGGDGAGNGNGTGDAFGDGNATGIYTPSPAYPSEARSRNIEGSVRVELAIAHDGSCAVRQIIESSGSPLLDDAVLKTVTRWKYRPAEEDGRPDTTTKRLRFTFSLRR